METAGRLPACHFPLSNCRATALRKWGGLGVRRGLTPQYCRPIAQCVRLNRDYFGCFRGRKQGIRKAGAFAGEIEDRKVNAGASIETRADSGERYQYRLDAEGHATIVKCSSPSVEVRVPHELDGYEVWAIGDSAFARSFTIKRVALPEGLKSIGQHAFKGCVTLREVGLPTTLQSVGSQAFWATALERLDIPAACTEVEDDSFCLYGSWISPPSTIRPSTIAQLTVDPGNPVLCMQGGVLCRRTQDGLRALLCPRGCESVSLTGPIATVLPAAFTGVSSIAHVRISENLRATGREIVFPSTSCETLVIERSDGKELSLSMPTEDVARKTLAKLFRACAIDLEGALKAFDDELRAVPGRLEFAKAALDRLSTGCCLPAVTERQYRMRISSSLEGICLGFASSNYWKGFDQLLECDLLSEGSIAHIIDILTQYDEVAAAGYLLQSKRRRFGEAAWDYDL